MEIPFPRKFQNFIFNPHHILQELNQSEILVKPKFEAYFESILEIPLKYFFSHDFFFAMKLHSYILREGTSRDLMAEKRNGLSSC